MGCCLCWSRCDAPTCEIRGICNCPHGCCYTVLAILCAIGGFAMNIQTIVGCFFNRIYLINPISGETIPGSQRGFGLISRETDYGFTPDYMTCSYYSEREYLDMYDNWMKASRFFVFLAAVIGCVAMIILFLTCCLAFSTAMFEQWLMCMYIWAAIFMALSFLFYGSQHCKDNHCRIGQTSGQAISTLMLYLMCMNMVKSFSQPPPIDDFAETYDTNDDAGDSLYYETEDQKYPRQDGPMKKKRELLSNYRSGSTRSGLGASTRSGLGFEQGASTRSGLGFEDDDQQQGGAAGNRGMGGDEASYYSEAQSYYDDPNRQQQQQEPYYDQPPNFDEATYDGSTIASGTYNQAGAAANVAPGGSVAGGSYHDDGGSYAGGSYAGGSHAGNSYAGSQAGGSYAGGSQAGGSYHDGGASYAGGSYAGDGSYAGGSYAGDGGASYAGGSYAGADGSRAAGGSYHESDITPVAQGGNVGDFGYGAGDDYHQQQQLLQQSPDGSGSGVEMVNQQDNGSYVGGDGSVSAAGSQHSSANNSNYYLAGNEQQQPPPPLENNPNFGYGVGNAAHGDGEFVDAHEQEPIVDLLDADSSAYTSAADTQQSRDLMTDTGEYGTGSVAAGQTEYQGGQLVPGGSLGVADQQQQQPDYLGGGSIAGAAASQPGATTVEGGQYYETDGSYRSGAVPGEQYQDPGEEEINLGSDPYYEGAPQAQDEPDIFLGQGVEDPGEEEIYLGAGGGSVEGGDPYYDAGGADGGGSVEPDIYLGGGGDDQSSAYDSAVQQQQQQYHAGDQQYHAGDQHQPGNPRVGEPDGPEFT